LPGLGRTGLRGVLCEGGRDAGGRVRARLTATILACDRLDLALPASGLCPRRAAAPARRVRAPRPGQGREVSAPDRAGNGESPVPEARDPEGLDRCSGAPEPGARERD